MISINKEDPPDEDFDLDYFQDLLKKAMQEELSSCLNKELDIVDILDTIDDLLSNQNLKELDLTIKRNEDQSLQLFINNML